MSNNKEIKTMTGVLNELSTGTSDITGFGIWDSSSSTTREYIEVDGKQDTQKRVLC